ncbi:MAG: insulinase family protein [Treponema sp.]|nr:insulinase family protein [Treponema sp.]
MKKISYIGMVLLALVMVSCASNAGAAKAKGASYYESNAADFSTVTLSNGIPVVFKKNNSGKIYVVRMVIDGGSSVIPASKSGLEDAVLEMIQYGSEKYPYTDIQRLKFEQSFSITSSTGFDYSTYNFRCIEKYLDGVLDVFADIFLHPLFKSEDFDKLKTEYAEGIQRSLTDPSGLLALTMRKVAFEGHPYASNPSVIKESYDAITLDAIKEHYKTILNANRLKIVVVGDLAESVQNNLVEKLEASFGKIPSADFTKPKIPDLTVRGKTVYEKLEQAGDSGYAFGFYLCPERTSADYIPYALATMYIEEALFSQVREQKGAVYSAGSGIIGGEKLLGVLSVYRASKPENLQQYIYDAIDSFPDERGVAEKLDQYKNKYINALFSSAQDASGVAGNIVSSLQYYGDPTTYLHRAEKVQAVTADQVLTAYRAYLARSSINAANGKVNPIRWVVVDKDGRYTFGK